MLSPDDAVRLGLENSRGAEAARADAAEARAASREAAGTLLPSFRANASATRLGGDIPSGEIEVPGFDVPFPFLPIERNRITSEWTVEQPVFAGGALLSARRAAARLADAAERSAAQAEADVAFEIRSAYWDLVRATGRLAAVEAARAGTAEHVRVVTARVDAGAALASERLAAEARLSELALDRVDAENAVRVASLELNRLVGLPLDTRLELTGSAVVEPLPSDGQAWVEEVVAMSPAIDAMERRVEALAEQLRSARGTLLPRVSLLGRYVLARPNPYALLEQDEFRGTWEAGFTMQWVPWDGGQNRARGSQARERLRGAELRLADARERMAVEAVYRRLEAERAALAVDVANLNLRQAEEALRVAREQYQEGVLLSAHVLDAEQAVRLAASRGVAAMADRAIAGAALLQAVGEVW